MQFPSQQEGLVQPTGQVSTDRVRPMSQCVFCKVDSRHLWSSDVFEILLVNFDDWHLKLLLVVRFFLQ